MKKILFSSLLFLLIMLPFSVQAQDYSYDVCSNCAYKDLNTVFNDINSQVYSDLDNVNINLKDEEYIINNGSLKDKKINLNINGANKTKIKLMDNFSFSNISGVNINNINVTSENKIFIFQMINDLNLKNIYLDAIKNSSDKLGLINIEALKVSINNVYFKECESINGLNIVADTSDINITNSDFSGVDNGIYVLGNNNSKYQFNIDNTILNNKNFSVISYVNIKDENKTKAMNNISDTYSVNKLGYLDSIIDTSSINFINIANSKLVGLKAYSEVSFSEIKNIIYADYTNTWLKEINTDVTVVSALSGKVYYDDVRKKILTMNVNDKQNLNAVFGVQFSDDTMWEITDPGVLKIENGNIVGLKTGSTTIMAKTNLDVYEVEATIINNPVTVSTIYITIIIVLLVSFGTGIVITIKDNNKNNKTESLKESSTNNSEIKGNTTETDNSDDDDIEIL